MRVEWTPQKKQGQSIVVTGMRPCIVCREIAAPDSLSTIGETASGNPTWRHRGARANASDSPGFFGAAASPFISARRTGLLDFGSTEFFLHCHTHLRQTDSVPPLLEWFTSIHFACLFFLLPLLSVAFPAVDYTATRIFAPSIVLLLPRSRLEQGCGILARTDKSIHLPGWETNASLVSLGSKSRHKRVPVCCELRNFPPPLTEIPLNNPPGPRNLAEIQIPLRHNPPPPTGANEPAQIEIIPSEPITITSFEGVYVSRVP